MTPDQPQGKKRSKRMYVLWAIALTLLVTTALFCWLVAAPVWRTRAVVARCRAELDDRCPNRDDIRKYVPQLGGPDAAAEGLWMYIVAPAWAAPHESLAIGLLPGCGEGGYERLKQLLADKDPNVRISAVTALGCVDGRAEEVLSLLGKALREEPENVRYAAILSLHQLSLPVKSIESDLAATARDEDADTLTRIGAMGLISDIEGPSTGVVPALLAATRAQDPRVQGAAVRTLGRLYVKAPRLRGHILPALESRLTPKDISRWKEDALKTDRVKRHAVEEERAPTPKRISLAGLKVGTDWYREVTAPGPHAMGPTTYSTAEARYRVVSVRAPEGGEAGRVVLEVEAWWPQSDAQSTSPYRVVVGTDGSFVGLLVKRGSEWKPFQEQVRRLSDRRNCMLIRNDTLRFYHFFLPMPIGWKKHRLERTTYWGRPAVIDVEPVRGNSRLRVTCTLANNGTGDAEGDIPYDKIVFMFGKREPWPLSVTSTRFRALTLRRLGDTEDSGE